MSFVNRNDMTMEKRSFILSCKYKLTCILTSLDFVIWRGKSSEKLNKIVSKLFCHLDYTSLNKLNITKTIATYVLKTFIK